MITVYVLVSFYDENGLHKQGTITKVSEEDFNPLYMKKVNIPSGGESLEDLSDVAISSVDDGETLVYDESTGKWVNGIAGDGSIIDNIQIDSNSNVESIDIDGNTYDFSTGETTISYVQLNSDDKVELMNIDGDNYFFAEGQSTLENFQENGENKVQSFEIDGSTYEFTSIEDITTASLAGGEVVESMMINGDHYDFGVGQSTLNSATTTQKGYVDTMDIDGDSYDFATELNELEDVNVGSATDGQVLTYDNGEWKPTTPELHDLDDVNISSPSAGQVLKYDATSQKWINGSAGGGGGSALLVTLTDAFSQTPIQQMNVNASGIYTISETIATILASDIVDFQYDTSAGQNVFIQGRVIAKDLSVPGIEKLFFVIPPIGNSSLAQYEGHVISGGNFQVTRVA